MAAIFSYSSADDIANCRWARRVHGASAGAHLTRSKQEYAKCCARAQWVTTVGKEAKYYAPVNFTPDLKFGDAAIGDVKYALDDGKWRRSDLYQLLAFAIAHQCSRALLVNFHPSTPQEASVQVSGTALQRLCWQLTCPEQAAEHLVEQVKSWLSLGAVA